MWKQVVGRVIFVFGIVGLLLNLILWLPVEMSRGMMAVVSVVCVVCIWSGGRLGQVETHTSRELRSADAEVHREAEGVQQGGICRNCGSPIAPGYRFCGICGSRLAAVCPTCGAVVDRAATFCTSCGVKLG